MYIIHFDFCSYCYVDAHKNRCMNIWGFSKLPENFYSNKHLI